MGLIHLYLTEHEDNTGSHCYQRTASFLVTVVLLFPSVLDRKHPLFAIFPSPLTVPVTQSSTRDLLNSQDMEMLSEHILNMKFVMLLFNKQESISY